MTALLEVRGLRTLFATDDGELPAVDGVSLSVDPGRTLAIVGESGCGKSVTALSIMGLVPSPPGRIAAGSIRFEGRELVGAPTRELQDLRGNDMAMIFQEPMSSLNPAITIGDQIVEGLLRHRAIGRAVCRSAWQQAFSAASSTVPSRASPTPSSPVLSSSSRSPWPPSSARA